MVILYSRDRNYSTVWQIGWVVAELDIVGLKPPTNASLRRSVRFCILPREHCTVHLLLNTDTFTLCEQSKSSRIWFLLAASRCDVALPQLSKIRLWNDNTCQCFVPFAKVVGFYNTVLHSTVTWDMFLAVLRCRYSTVQYCTHTNAAIDWP